VGVAVVALAVDLAVDPNGGRSRQSAYDPKIRQPDRRRGRRPVLPIVIRGASFFVPQVGIKWGICGPSDRCRHKTIEKTSARAPTPQHISGYRSSPSRCGPTLCCLIGRTRDLPVPVQGTSAHAREKLMPRQLVIRWSPAPRKRRRRGSRTCFLQGRRVNGVAKSSCGAKHPCDSNVPSYYGQSLTSPDRTSATTECLQTR
jgi:hypothetical protein